MSDIKVTIDGQKPADAAAGEKCVSGVKPVWVAPKLEDVSEQVMAQPYIRFT